MGPSQEAMKRAAAARAAGLVKDGMVLGLGSGSTVAHFLLELSRRIGQQSLSISGVATSKATEERARSLGIPLTTLDEQPELDLDIDGADEVDASLNLIKGGGGAHVREKIVAKASKSLIIIVDETKLSKRLGERSPVPVEVIPLAAKIVSAEISEMGGRPSVRREKGGQRAYVTDNGNFILDCDFGPIEDPALLEATLKSMTGVVDSGIFSGMTDQVIVGSQDGSRILRRES